MHPDASPEATEFLRRLSESCDGSPDEIGGLLETFRGYLLVVAAGQIPPTLRTKVGASDLVQETLLKAHRHFAQFRGATSEELVGWLREILGNCTIDAARKFHGTQMRQLARELPLPGEADQPSFDPQDPSPTPRAAAMTDEESRLLATALKRLPARHQQAVLLRNWERLPFEEVGRRLNCTAEAARKLWFRAVERLRSELEPRHGR